MNFAITLSALVAACSADAGIYLPHGAGYGAAPYPSHYGYATDDFHVAAPVAVAAPLPVARFAVRPEPVIRNIAPVAAVRAAPIAPVAVAAVRAAPIAPVAVAAPVAAVRTAPIAPIAAPVAAVRAAPIAVAEVRAAPVADVRAGLAAGSSQFHSQDESGNFAFGYQNINSARQEAGNIHTGLAGSFTDGRRTTNYVADNYGFRITN